MAKDFSLTKYFREQYIKEFKSNAQKETDAMRSSTFTSYNKDGEQPYLKEFKTPKSFDPDTIRLVREMLYAADVYHDELVDDADTDDISSYLDKRTGGTIFKFPHYNGPGPGALFGKETTDQIERSKAAAKAAALKTYTQFKTYIEDYEITDVSPAGVYGNVYLWVMFNDLAKDYTAPIGGTQSSQFEAMDMNDPVLMKMRAAKLANKKADKEIDNIKRMNPKADRKSLDMIKQIGMLQKEREQLMRDMEQEAEPEGGPIADMYGAKLNRIDSKIAKLTGRKEMTYNQAIAMDEGSCGYTPDGKPRSKPAGPNLMELKEKIFNSLKK